ncbi:NAD(P)/FAD-dependent oxidoreductase [Paraburkholderia sediminicola]|uniref:NAD(P)/FAD-dependent oxidoreductase n=1 Tax=Paraburkholderia sediminicola TaxID=458836 RepID=UPI0038BD1CDB
MQSQNFIIVGGGQAGRRAAEVLRERAPDARICIIGDETHLPYDRPSLSKDALLDEEREQHAFIRNVDYYRSQRIEVRLGLTVTAINRADRLLTLSDGSEISYDRLLLATGSRVRKLQGGPVHYLRTLDDARNLRMRLAQGARVVIVGGGFIGLEVAATAIGRGCAVTLVEPADRLLKRSMPPEVSEFMRQLHVGRGVEFRLGAQVTDIQQALDGSVRVATSERELFADVVVAGIGVVPNTELAQQAGLEVRDGIVVNDKCRTSDPDIFAAGEVTQHFVTSIGRHVRVESWQVAEKQPAVAAANMLGATERYDETPWLWSDQYDCNVQSLGTFDGAHTVVLRGAIADGTFSMIGLNGAGNVRAAVTVNNGKDMAIFARMVAGGPIDANQLADTSVSLRSLLKR